MNRPTETCQSDLGHGHSAVALVVPELGLLVGRDSQRRIVQLGTGSPNGLPENLLKPLVDVYHGFTEASVLVLQTLKTHNTSD